MRRRRDSDSWQPAIAEARDLPRGDAVFVCELDLDRLTALAAARPRESQPLPRYPVGGARRVDSRRRHLVCGDRSWHDSGGGAAHAGRRARVRSISGQGHAGRQDQSLAAPHLPRRRSHADRRRGEGGDATDGGGRGAGRSARSSDSTRAGEGQAMAKTTTAVGVEPIDRLEEKIKLLVSIIGRLQGEQSRLVDDNARLQRELSALQERLQQAEDAGGEVVTLREERDRHPQPRVGEMLAELDALQPLICWAMADPRVVQVEVNGQRYPIRSAARPELRPGAGGLRRPQDAGRLRRRAVERRARAGDPRRAEHRRRVLPRARLAAASRRQRWRPGPSSWSGWSTRRWPWPTTSGLDPAPPGLES